LIPAATVTSDTRLSFVAFISAIERRYSALFTVGRSAAINTFPAMRTFFALTATNDQYNNKDRRNPDTECLHWNVSRAFMGISYDAMATR
jgi:hypothetical protein